MNSTLSTKSVGSTLPVPDRVEEITPKITIEYYFDGEFIALTIKDNRHETIDIWFDTITSIVSAWPKDKSLCFLFDCSSHEATITPYIRERSRKLMQADFGVKTHTAIVLPQTIWSRVIFLFIRSLPQPPGTSLYIALNRPSAFKYLQKFIVFQPQVEAV